VGLAEQVAEGESERESVHSHSRSLQHPLRSSSRLLSWDREREKESDRGSSSSIETGYNARTRRRSDGRAAGEGFGG
jgi:hypothetical protein